MVHPSQIKITRLELHDVMRGAGKREDKARAVIHYVLRKFDNDVSEATVPTELRKKFLPAYFKKWNAQRCNMDHFLKKNGEWLKGEVKFSEKCFPKLKKADQKPKGRPSKAFDDCSDSAKRKKTTVIRDNHSLEELVYATASKLREAGDNAAARLLNECRSTTPTRSKRILSKWRRKETVQSRVTLEEAWTLIRKRKLSKRTYFEIRRLAAAHGHNVYPPYRAVTVHQKRKRMRKRTGAAYEGLVNDTLNGSVEPFESEACQESTIPEESEIDDEINCKKGNILQMDINHSQEVMMPEHATKEELLNTSFTEITVEPQVIQFQGILPTKVEYTDMQVVQASVNQEHPTDWPIYSLPTTSYNYCYNGSEFF